MSREHMDVRSDDGQDKQADLHRRRQLLLLRKKNMRALFSDDENLKIDGC
mgnify:CR=1 FL=1